MNRFQRRCANLVQAETLRGGRVLEVSCGQGEILRALAGAGYDVVGTNYSDHGAAPGGLDIRSGVDLRRALPFDDASFDAVILSDVIEHISDHDAALREVSRVLRVGGIAVILTPNTNRITSRLHFLFTGFLKPKRSFIGFDVPAEKAFAFHNHPPHLPVFLYQAHSRGLELARLEGEWIKPKSVLLWLLLGPGIALATWFSTALAERHLKGRAEGKLLRRALTSFQALCGEAWVMVLRKSPAAKELDGGEVEIVTRLPDWHRAASAAAPVAPRVS